MDLKKPSLLMDKVNTIEAKIDKRLDKIEIAVAKLEQVVKNHNRLLWFLLVLITTLFAKLTFDI